MINSIINPSISFIIILVIISSVLSACTEASVSYQDDIVPNDLEASSPFETIIIDEYEIIDVENNILNYHIEDLCLITPEDNQLYQYTIEAPHLDPIIVAIDPGHQRRGNSEHEPIGPDARETKPKVSGGTKGVYTNVPEYELTLAVSLLLRDELLSRGYEVVLIRENHDVDISNRERAGMATEAGADIFVRLHADGSTNSNINGILLLCPRADNPFVAHLYEESRLLSEFILEAMIAATGAKNRGIMEINNMSGINWATMPVTIIEMGVMTNPTEDKLMQTEEYQLKLVTGIADGIDAYFN